MRWGATVYVMRYGPPMAWPTHRRQVSVAYHAFTLTEALAWVLIHRTRVTRAAWWIARKGANAHRRPPRARAGRPRPPFTNRERDPA